MHSGVLRGRVQCSYHPRRRRLGDRNLIFEKESQNSTDACGKRGRKEGQKRREGRVHKESEIRTDAVGLGGWKLDGDPEAAQLDRRRVLLAREEGALRLQVAVDYVVLVTVLQGFQYLTHVMTVTRQSLLPSLFPMAWGARIHRAFFPIETVLRILSSFPFRHAIVVNYRGK